jgi:CheY-like chemotaxis protein
MMLTSLDRMGDASRCEELGIKSYLIKPVKQSDLFDAIVLALEGERRGPVKSADGDEAIPAIKPLSILLAEDSLANQKLAKGLLSRWGHELTIVNNGLEAVAAAKKGDFDLVLMDVQMPELDGLEATSQIRQWERGTGRHMAIVAMTAHAMKGDRERCLAAGMDGYCPKPIRPRELSQVILHVLPDAALPRGFIASTPVVAAEPDIKKTPAPTAESTVMENHDGVIDWKAALSSMQGDEDLLFDVIEAHLSESPDLFGQLERAVSQQDAPLTRRLAHTLKGNLRALQIIEPPLAAILEENAARGDLSPADDLLPKIGEQLQRVNQVLETRMKARRG